MERPPCCRFCRGLAAPRGPQKPPPAGAGRPAAGHRPEGQGTPFFINLERGIAFDRGFGQWVSMVRSFGPATGKGSLLPEYKQPLTLEVCGENGKILYSYHLFSCWVTEYRARASPDAGSPEISIEHLRLGFEEWERDQPEGA